MQSKTYEARFKTKTGKLCLDFTNTVDWHASAKPEETLSAYGDLLRWAEGVRIVPPDIAKAFLAESEGKPALAKNALSKAVELREAIYRILSSKARGGEVMADDLSVLNTAIASSMSNARLEKNDGGFGWNWTLSASRLDSILWPVAWSAAGLLTSEAIGRVGECDDEKGCGWLFFDTSRNRSRRWCDMRDCGNRAKSRRHYQKSHVSA